MENKQEQLEALKDIRQMMKQSTRFLSLSGLSGILAGVYALAGIFVTTLLVDSSEDYNSTNSSYPSDTVLLQCAAVCLSVLILSIVTALFFSSRNAKKTGEKLYDHTAKRLVTNMFIPLATGGVFCFSMLYHGDKFIFLIAPAMLIFYGLALVNGSKYTLNDIRYLGCIEIGLGLLAAFFPYYGIILLALGFGVLHIIYGAFMWFKYERG